MPKLKIFLKRLAPIYFRYFRIQYANDISWRNAFFVALASFSYAFLGSALTVMITEGYGLQWMFVSAVFYYSALLFSTKIMAFSKTIGQLIFILSAATGFVVATMIF